MSNHEITVLSTVVTRCSHDDNTSTRLAGDPCASAWDCDNCGHLTPFNDADYEFCNSSPWSPRAPEGMQPLVWLFMSREARLAHYAA